MTFVNGAEVAVLGGGVIGLSTAVLFAEDRVLRWGGAPWGSSRSCPASRGPA